MSPKHVLKRDLSIVKDHCDFPKNLINVLERVCSIVETKREAKNERINSNYVRTSSGWHGCIILRVLHKMHEQKERDWERSKRGNPQFPPFGGQFLVSLHFVMFRASSKCLSSLSRNARMLLRTSGNPTPRVFAGAVAARYNAALPMVFWNFLQFHV